MTDRAFFRRQEAAAPPFHQLSTDGFVIAPDFVVFLFAVKLAIVSTIVANAIGISVQ